MMDKRQSCAVPPPLPPKLYKMRQIDSQSNNSLRTMLPCKDVSNGRKPSFPSSANFQQSTGKSRRPERPLNPSVRELRGKPRDELVLMLLQLNHEKANLQRWQEYFTEQIMQLTLKAEVDPKAEKEIEALRTELKDVEEQLKACIPVITFLNNKIRMNDVCAGGDIPTGGSDYEKPSRSISRQKSIEFLRREEERDVARSLEAEMHRTSAAIGKSYGLITSAEMFELSRQPAPEMASYSRLLDYPEDPAVRKRRLQLEAELRQLDKLWEEACAHTPTPTLTIPKPLGSTSRRQKSTVSRRVANRLLDYSETVRPKSACDMESLAYRPRRSTRSLHRSDLSSSFSADLERQTRPPSCASAEWRGSGGPLDRPLPRSVSSGVLGRPAAYNKQRRGPENCKTRKDSTPPKLSAFLAEPCRAPRSRWKVSMEEEEEEEEKEQEEDSTTASPISSSPLLLPTPPLPGQAAERITDTTSSNKAQLNRWRSFGDNLTDVDPQLTPLPRESRMSNVARKSTQNIKSPDTNSDQSLLFRKRDNSTPLQTEDPYEETPFVDSQYLTPRPLTPSKDGNSSPSTTVNSHRLEERPLPPSSITAAVEYIPGEGIDAGQSGDVLASRPIRRASDGSF